MNENGAAYGCCAGKFLSANAEAGDEVFITLLIFSLHVVEKPAPLGYHFQQATTGVIVLFVVLEMFGQILDAFCQHCNLYVR